VYNGDVTEIPWFHCPPFRGLSGRGRMRCVGLNLLLRAMTRRWYVVVVIALATAAAAVTLPRVEGVYWTRVSVVFLAPTSPLNDNALTPTPEALVAFAAIVERELNNAPTVDRFSSQGATLYGSGVRKGTTVELVNSGNQWSPSFGDPVLTIDTVDSTEQLVRDDVEASVARIEELALTLQQQAGVAETDLITTLPSPESPVVSFTRGNRLRATGGIVALGLLAAAGAALATDRVLLARSRRRDGDAPEVAAPEVERARV
jgi:hypothetical protein